MIPLKDISTVSTLQSGLLAAMLAEGWVFLAVEPNGSGHLYHLGLPADEQENWTVAAAEFLAGLDPDVIDRAAMEGASFDEPYGARRVIGYLLSVLGK